MNSLLRNWREAGWSVRAVYLVIVSEIGAIIIVGLWLG